MKTDQTLVASARFYKSVQAILIELAHVLNLTLFVCRPSGSQASIIQLHELDFP